jgi:protein gp37
MLTWSTCARLLERRGAGGRYGTDNRYFVVRFHVESRNGLRRLRTLAAGAGKRHCYAGLLTGRYAGRNGWPKSFDEPQLFLHRLSAALRWPDLRGQCRPEKPWLNGLPRLIFLNDMGDTFTESLPLDWLGPVWQSIADSCHLWLVLTKRPQRMREFLRQYGCPANVWPGVSVTSSANLARLDELAKVDSPMRWLSAEPLLSALEVSRLDPSVLRWVVVGGESGRGARVSELQWFRDIRNHCSIFGIPFFMKQLGSVHGAHKGTDSIPPDLLVREVPGPNSAAVFAQETQ